MVCYHPMQAIRDDFGGVTIIGAWRGREVEDRGFPLPCGQCIGCRLERSRQWAVRCMHEAKSHAVNCFVTLTYDDDHLPSDGSLQLDDWQRFFKRFRKAISPCKVRFFHCGEYGDELGRPHYHACVFGYDFPDKYLWERRNGFPLYRSPTLEQLWTGGNSRVADFSFETAAYVARYILKKRLGKDADLWYEGRQPEYTTMSRRPGIGYDWLQQYAKDTYKDDSVIVRERACKPPRYYDSLYEIIDPDDFERIKRERKIAADNSGRDDSVEVLCREEVCRDARQRQVVRPLHIGDNAGNRCVSDFWIEFDKQLIGGEL